MSTQFENLVLEGGGIKGFAYIGMLKAMNELGTIKNIKKIIGTSIGSVFAVFAALNCTNNELDEYSDILFKEAGKFTDGFMKETVNLVKGIGIHSNDKICGIIDTILDKKLGIKNVTFLQLFEKTNVELTIVGTCYTTQTADFFNYKTYPNMTISQAIQISTAIPLFFTIVEWDNKQWCDGGVVQNFAIEYYDHENGKYNDSTLGIYLQEMSDKDKKTDIDKKTCKINNIVDLIKSIETIELNNNINQSIMNPEQRNIIYVDTGNISSVDFGITDAQKNFLINNGYDATKKFLDIQPVQSLMNKLTAIMSFFQN